MEHLLRCSSITAIGGGSGLGKVLSSLSFLDDRLTGIVATTDDGGSTGRLRQTNSCIAWGDVRNCMNQICEDSPNLSRILFEYRIKSKGELGGHSLGNIILLAIDQMCVRPLDAINLIRNMLSIRAKIIPMSEEPTKLTAIINNTKIIGETAVDSLSQQPESLYLTPRIKPTAEAGMAIESADILLLGPGSFMSSIMPALLIPEIITSIQNSKAKKIFLANIKKETTIVGKLSIGQQLDWMQRMTGIYPDILLYPKECGSLEKVYCPVETHKLSDPLNPHIHRKEAICSALNLIIKKYSIF